MVNEDRVHSTLESQMDKEQLLGMVTKITQGLLGEFSDQGSMMGFFLDSQGVSPEQKKKFAQVRQEFKDVDPKGDFTNRLKTEFLANIAEIAKGGQNPATLIAKAMETRSRLFGALGEKSAAQGAKFVGQLLALRVSGIAPEDFCYYSAQENHTVDSLVNELCADNLNLGLETSLIMFNNGTEKSISILSRAKLENKNDKTIDEGLAHRARMNLRNRKEPEASILKDNAGVLADIRTLVEEEFPPTPFEELSVDKLDSKLRLIFRVVNSRTAANDLEGGLVDPDDEITLLKKDPQELITKVREILAKSGKPEKILAEITALASDATARRTTIEYLRDRKIQDERQHRLIDHADSLSDYAAYYLRHFESTIDPKLMSKNGWLGYYSTLNEVALKNRKADPDNVEERVQEIGMLKGAILYGRLHGFFANPE